MFERIEELKRNYTDKYVVVEGNRPELARFRGQTGQIKTVNMSGRALVEFDAYNNIGWYDIELDYLKVVDKPPPKPAEKAEKPAAKPAPAKVKPVAETAAPGEKKLSPLEMARLQGAARKDDKQAAAPAAGSAEKPAPAGKPKSTAEILAAARTPKAAEQAVPAPKPKSTAEILAAARAGKTGQPPAAQAAPEAKPAPAKPVSAGKPEAAEQAAPAPKIKGTAPKSTAEILAAARAGKTGQPPAAQVTPAAPAKPAPAKPVSAGKPEAAAPKPAPPAAKGKLSTAEVLAAARAGQQAKAAVPAPSEDVSSKSGDEVAAEQSTNKTNEAAEDSAETVGSAVATSEPADDTAAGESEAAAQQAVKKPSAPAATGPLPTTMAEKIAWCRRVDAKSGG